MIVWIFISSRSPRPGHTFPSDPATDRFRAWYDVIFGHRPLSGKHRRRGAGAPAGFVKTLARGRKKDSCTKPRPGHFFTEKRPTPNLFLDKFFHFYRVIAKIVTLEKLEALLYISFLGTGLFSGKAAPNARNRKSFLAMTGHPDRGRQVCCR